MTKELTIPKRKSLSNPSVYEDFNLSLVLGDLEETERSGIIDKLSGVAVGADVLAGLTNLKRFSVEIPSELLEGMKSGNFGFDKSSKIAGNFTPNIRDLDGKLVGQATIKEGVNPQALTSSVANLAMYAMLANISAKLDSISDSIHVVQVGQENDRRAKVVSGFVDFYLAYKSSLSDADKKAAARTAYSKMSEGLDQIHFELAELGNYKHFKFAPKSGFGAFVYGNSGMTKYRNRYNELCNKLIEYQQLSLLTELVCLNCYDEGSAKDRHNISSNLYKNILQGEHAEALMQRLSCITDTPVNELFVYRFLETDKEYSEILNSPKCLKLETDSTEITFNSSNYEQ